MASQNSSGYYGVDFKERKGSDLAFFASSRRRSAVNHFPLKKQKGSGISLQMDVMWVSQLVIIKDGDR